MEDHSHISKTVMVQGPTLGEHHAWVRVCYYKGCSWVWKII